MSDDNDIRHGRHCVFLMHVHLVFVTKYRREVFTKEILDDLRNIFSSVCVGALMRGVGAREAMKLAADYTADTIRATLQNPKKPWYGVDFEATLPELINS